MATIVPQMAKLSVKDLLETRQRLEADILKMLEDFEALTGVEICGISLNESIGYVTWGTSASAPTTHHPGTATVRVELSL